MGHLAINPKKHWSGGTVSTSSMTTQRNVPLFFMKYIITRSKMLLMMTTIMRMIVDAHLTGSDDSSDYNKPLQAYSWQWQLQYADHDDRTLSNHCIWRNCILDLAASLLIVITNWETGTLFGCMPNNLVFVNAGSRLGELRSLTDLYDIKMILIGTPGCFDSCCRASMMYVSSHIDYQHNTVH